MNCVWCVNEIKYKTTTPNSDQSSDYLYILLFFVFVVYQTPKQKQLTEYKQPIFVNLKVLLALLLSTGLRYSSYTVNNNIVILKQIRAYVVYRADCHRCAILYPFNFNCKQRSLLVVCNLEL